MLYTVHDQLHATGLATLALLNPQVGDTLGAGVAVNPVDNALRVVAIALNAKVLLAVMGEVTVLVDTEAGGAGALGQSGRVREGQTGGGNLAVDNVEVLPTSGSLVLGCEGGPGGGVAATD